MKNKNDCMCKAKKEYICNNCGKTIKKGEKYRRVNIMFEGVIHFCLECEKKVKQERKEEPIYLSFEEEQQFNF